MNKHADNLFYISGIHEFELLCKIHSYLKNGDTLIDIGANAGTSILWLQNHKLKRNLSFVAFGAMPFNAEIIEKHLVLNPSVDCRVVTIALGSEQGKIKFSTAGIRDGSAHAINQIGEKNDREIIEADLTTLDHCYHNNKQPVWAILIDVEGFGVKVLKGALNTIEKYSPMIFIEIHNDEDKNGVTSILNNLGYALKESIVDAYTHFVFIK